MTGGDAKAGAGDAPEFSRAIALDRLGDRARALSLSATDAECAALARRFALPAIERLTAEIELRRAGDAVDVTGDFRGEVVQSCAVTGAPLRQLVEGPLALRFVPESELDFAETGAGVEEEVELSEADCDLLAHDGRVVDAGEAVAQTLMLSLDPFPRAPDADEAARAAGLASEEEAGPFGALADFRERLEKGG